MDLLPEAAPVEEAQLPGAHLLPHIVIYEIIFTKDFVANPHLWIGAALRCSVWSDAPSSDSCCLDLCIIL